MINIGVISEVRGKRARVKIGSTLTTDFLPVLQTANSFMQIWKPLRVGEQCIILPILGELNAGVILRGLDSTDYSLPSENKNEHKTVYEDGTSISYDTSKKLLNVNLSKDATININDKANITVGSDANIKVGGKTNVECSLSTFSGTVVVGSLVVGGAGGSKITSTGDTLTVDNNLVVKKNAHAEIITDSKGNVTDHSNGGLGRDG